MKFYRGTGFMKAIRSYLHALLALRFEGKKLNCHFLRVANDAFFAFIIHMCAFPQPVPRQKIHFLYGGAGLRGIGDIQGEAQFNTRFYFIRRHRQTAFFFNIHLKNDNLVFFKTMILLGVLGKSRGHNSTPERVLNCASPCIYY